MRTTAGIDLQTFGVRFGMDFQEVFGEVIADFEKDGLLSVSRGRCALTRRGLAFADSISAAFAARGLPDSAVA